MLKFYPNKWTFLSAIILELFITVVILLIMFSTNSTYSESIPYVIALIILGVIIGAPLIIRGTACVHINNEELIIKRNIFSRQTILLKDEILNVFIQYRKAKTITVITNKNQEINFDCTYIGLSAIIKYISHDRISVFYIAREFVPKKHRELLLSTNILKKGNHRGYLK